eukprot:SAG22_NODE_4807_length_1159_cov_1.354717_1_plen_333_part_00
MAAAAAVTAAIGRMVRAHPAGVPGGNARGVRAALVAAQATANVVKDPAWMIRVRDWLFNRLSRALGGDQFIWPPSKKSLPLLAGTWLGLAVIIWFLVREKKNGAIDQIQTIRKDYALGSLENLLGNERVRLREFAEKQAALTELGLEPARAKFMTRKEIRELAKELKAKARSERYRKIDEAREAAGEPKLEHDEEDSDDEEGKKTADQLATEEVDDKVEPPSSKLFELVYDEIEGKPITSIGVAPDDERLAEGMLLLKKRVLEEMHETLEKTKLARKYSAGIPIDMVANVPRDLQHFADGDKLLRVARFAKQTICKKLKPGKHPTFDKKTVR